jgi:Domain of unknown function (DUF1963)
VPRDKASLVRLARQRLPAVVADRWAGLLRPSFHLRPAVDDEPAVGQLGGVPVLPDGVAWPRWEGRGPLAYIAEIDCGQLPSDSLSMPSIGTLSFFCWDGQIDGGMPGRGALANPAAARLLYRPAGTPVSERDPPAGIAPYDLVELAGELFTAGPAWDSPVFRQAIGDLGDDQGFMNDWSNGDAFGHALWELAPRAPDHRLGGHAKPIQDAVELDVAHAQLGGQIPYGNPVLHQEAQRWALLAQFDSDQRAGMMWGDCGTLYWLIRPGDLAARRFEEASFTWQCT